MSLIHRPTLHECALMSAAGQAGILGGAGAVSAGAAEFPTTGLALHWVSTDLTVNTTPDPDQVSAINDQTANNYDGTQSTSSLQPVYTASNASLGNQPSIDYADGTALYMLGATGTKSGLKGLHDGTGGLWWIYAKVLAYPAAQRPFLFTGLLTSHIGIQAQLGTTGQFVYQVYNGSAAIISASAAGAIAANTVQSIAAGYENGAGTEYQLFVDGSVVGSGSDTGTPSTSDATLALYFGSHVAAAAYEVAAFAAWDLAQTEWASTIAAADAWAAANYA